MKLAALCNVTFSSMVETARLFGGKYWLGFSGKRGGNAVLYCDNGAGTTLPPGNLVVSVPDYTAVRSSRSFADFSPLTPWLNPAIMRAAHTCLSQCGNGDSPSPDTVNFLSHHHSAYAT